MALVEHREEVFRSPLLDIVDYRSARSEPKRLLPEFVFDRPAILFPRRGVFFLHGAGEPVLGEPNQVLFCDAGKPFRVLYPGEEGDDCTFFRIRPDLLASITDGRDPNGADPRGARFPLLRILSGPEIYLFHQVLLDGARRGTFDAPLAVEEGVVELAAALIRAARASGNGRKKNGRRGTGRAHRDFAERVKAILAGEFERAPSLDEIARRVACSPYHLCRLFKAETGLTIHRYLNRLRLRAALDRVAEPDMSLTSIALDVGFSSHSHFTDAFRKEFGVSPSRFRREATIRRLALLHKRLVA